MRRQKKLRKVIEELTRSREGLAMARKKLHTRLKTEKKGLMERQKPKRERNEEWPREQSSC